MRSKSYPDLQTVQPPPELSISQLVDNGDGLTNIQVLAKQRAGSKNKQSKLAFIQIIMEIKNMDADKIIFRVESFGIY